MFKLLLLWMVEKAITEQDIVCKYYGYNFIKYIKQYAL